MTIENWLMIAVIISTLIAPLLALLMQSRISQPKPAPEPNQPKNLIQRMGGRIIRFLQSPWSLVVSFLGIPPSIYALLTAFRETSPVTRASVFLITEGVAGILFSLINASVLLNSQTIRLQTLDIRTQNETISELNAIVSRLLDMIKTLGNTVDVMGKTLALPEPAQSKIDKPTPGTLRKMLTAIENLFTKPN